MNNYFKFLTITAVLLINGIEAKEPQFIVSITNNLPYAITINDRKWDNPTPIATLNKGETQKFTELSVNEQYPAFRSSIELVKDGEKKADLVLINRFASGTNKPFVTISLLSVPHWIGGNKFVSQELEEDASVLSVDVNLQEDGDGILEPTQISFSYE